MGALICCVWKTFCCDCSSWCEPKDDWNIMDEVRPGERGAGWLYKRGKGAAVWSKRFFVLTDTKLLYYLSNDRAQLKGEIVLAGSAASPCSTRSNGKKQWYFTISHPICGSRELYAKTENRRAQWMEKINDISNSLSKSAAYGKLFKQGGLSKNTWQERWCICTGRQLDYFENATDNQAKGSIGNEHIPEYFCYVISDISNATIREFKQKDKNCFEISTAAPGKKGMKKYVFYAEKEFDAQQWAAALRKAAIAQDLPGGTASPMHSTASVGTKTGGDDEDEGEERDSEVSSVARKPSESHPPLKSGYLQKKSPAMMKGWQKRFFVIRDNGEIMYYKQEEEASAGSADAKGSIFIKDILSDVGLQVNKNTCELTIKMANKSVHLKGSSADEVQEWADCIAAWMKYLST